MTTFPQPLTRFLLPMDIPSSFARTSWLMGTMTAALGERIEKISILHVLAGRYLSSHMANVDVRTRHVVNSELFRKLKEQHISNDIAPKLEEVRALLGEAGVTAPVDILIEDGEPVQRISEVAGQGYSTIIMERRGLSPIKGIMVGSVAAGLLYRGIRTTVYLVGQTKKGKACPASCCLIPVDGSVHADEAVREAAILASHCREVVKEVVLVHVLNLARYGQEEQAAVGVAAGEEIVESACRILREGGVAADIISWVVRYGDPGDVISEEIDKRAACMVFMGRRGRNMLGELFMGSVSRKIIHRYPDNFVALVSAK